MMIKKALFVTIIFSLSVIFSGVQGYFYNESVGKIVSQPELEKQEYKYFIGDYYQRVLSLLSGLDESKFDRLEKQIAIEQKKLEVETKRIKYNLAKKKDQKEKIEKQLEIYNELIVLIEEYKKSLMIDIYKDISYGFGEKKSLDIYSTPEENAPIVFFVHGGAWKLGDKSEHEQKGKYFSGNGLNFVSVNYTLFPNASYDEQVEDVAQAFDFIYKNASKIDADNKKIFLMGHSAGGHLISLLSTDTKYLNAQGYSLKDISKVVSLDAGGYDIVGVKESSPFQFKLIYKSVFGDDEEDLKEASPITYVEKLKNIPEFHVVHSSTRNASQDENQIKFYDTLIDAGVDAYRYTYDYTHEEFNNNIGSDEAPEYSQDMLDIFKK